MRRTFADVLLGYSEAQSGDVIYIAGSSGQNSAGSRLPTTQPDSGNCAGSIKGSLYYLILLRSFLHARVQAVEQFFPNVGSTDTQPTELSQVCSWQYGCSIGCNGIRDPPEMDTTMLNWALAFFLVAIVAAIFRYHRTGHGRG